MNFPRFDKSVSSHVSALHFPGNVDTNIANFIAAVIFFCVYNVTLCRTLKKKRGKFVLIPEALSWLFSSFLLYRLSSIFFLLISGVEVRWGRGGTCEAK